MAASAPAAALSATLPLVRRVRPWQWTALDCVAALLFALPVIGGAGRPPNADKPWLDLVVAACSVAFVARRRYPVLVLTLLIIGMLILGKSPHHPYSDYQPLALMLTLYTVAAERPRWVSGIAIVAGFMMAAWIMWSRGNGPGATLMTGVAVGLAPPLAGYLKRETLVYAAAFTAEHARKTEAEVTARLADERMRIARELHDVVAHALSLITVQAGVAVFREHDEARLRETLASVETTGRGALMDMRRLLGVLRGAGTAGSVGVVVTGSDGTGGAVGPDRAGAGSAALGGSAGSLPGEADGGADAEASPGPAELAPMPGLDDLGSLVSQTAQAGLRVSLHVDGERRPLPAGLELAAYRIVQESLTNVLRHAGTTTGAVAVRYEAEALIVSVTNPGAPGGASGVGVGEVKPGHGLVGMAERVAMYQGDLRVGPLPGGGFSVVARLPVPASLVVAA